MAESKVIDCCVRPMTKEFSLPWKNSSPEMLRPMAGESDETPLDELFADFDRCGISKAVIIGREVFEKEGATPEHIAHLVKQYPERFVAGFAGMDPYRGMTGVRQTEKAIKDLGLKGVAFDTFEVQAFADDRVYYPFYTKISELGGAVVLTTGATPRQHNTMAYSTPVPIDQVASDFPELRVLIRHTGWPWVREAIAVAMRHKNVYLEFSLFYDFPGVEDFVKAANVVVPDQVVYASAYPVDPLNTLDKFKQLPFEKEVLPKVLYDNACRFLGVPG